MKIYVRRIYHQNDKKKTFQNSFTDKIISLFFYAAGFLFGDTFLTAAVCVCVSVSV